MLKWFVIPRSVPIVAKMHGSTYFHVGPRNLIQVNSLVYERNSIWKGSSK